MAMVLSTATAMLRYKYKYSKTQVSTAYDCWLQNEYEAPLSILSPSKSMQNAKSIPEFCLLRTDGGGEL